MLGLGNKEKKASRKMRQLNQASEKLLQDIERMIQKKGSSDLSEVEAEIASTATTRLPTKVVDLPGLKKDRAVRDRELMFGGTYMNRYNLGDLYQAYTRETYFKIAIDKYIEGVIKRGFHFASKTQKVIDYIRKRIKEIELVSGKTIKDLIRDMLFSVLAFGNTFLVKVRDRKRSSGMVHKWRGKVVRPIAGLYVADARRMIITENETGTGLKYMLAYRKVQPNRVEGNTNRWEYLKNLPSMFFNWGREKLLYPWGYAPYNLKLGKEYKAEDINHIRYHHTPGEKWAMPPFWPVLEDINILRSVETAVDLLIYQFGSLLVHVKVSNPVQNVVNAAVKRPAKVEDINAVKMDLDDMESNGFIVTGDHVDMQVLQVAGNILKISEYLAYFKERTFSGLWLSSVTVGESSQGIARSVADTIVEEKTAKIIELQDIIGAAVNDLMLELLLEAGLTPGQAFKEDVIPQIIFDDVDVELTLKKRDSIARLYEAGLITEGEGRQYIGYDELTDSLREETYPRLVKAYLLEVEAQGKATVAAASAKARASLTKSKTSSSTKTANSTSNSVTPQNQTGRKLNTKKAVNK